MNQLFKNAKQVFEDYGIPRSALRALVSEGKVACREISTSTAVTKLYSVTDLERLIGEVSDV